jgi:uncharacterized protein (DUF952 family)
MTQSLPFYLYKLVPSTSPVREPLPERLPVSELDQESGFIHLSTALQVPNTLKYFFKDEPLVYVLRIEFEEVMADIRWESPDAKVCGPRPDEGLFPVGSIFSLQDVTLAFSLIHL